jgi:uncharacterized repeat protein (TIGR01451 family)
MIGQYSAPGWLEGLPRRRTLIRTLAGGVSIFLALAGAVRASDGPLQRIEGHVPAAVSTAPLVADVPDSAPLRLVIGLPFRNRELLTNLLEATYNPADPHYHHYLSPDQFTEIFGPTVEDYEAVKAFATSNRLTVTGTHPNRTLLDVTGSAADIEKALHIKLHYYRHPVEGRNFRAPDTEPQLDLTVPVLHITGLDDYIIPHPLLVNGAAMKGAKPMSGSGPNGEYRGNDFRAAYVPGVSLTGTGQSVGLFELEGYHSNDIATYESQTGISPVTLQNVLVDGVSGIPDGNVNAIAEVSLDIEMAISMAPGLSNVLVYEGINNNNITDPNDVLDQMATDDIAKELSCSWGFNIDSSTVQTFQRYGMQGQSFFLASGDSGAYTGSIPAPSDDPYVTVVGGTTLSTTGPSGSWTGEKVWNWNTTGQGTDASSGGISTAYTTPWWQTNVNMTTNQGSATARCIPDVALTADAVYVVYATNQTGYFGGTSCAAPLWAGFTALVNEQAASLGQTNVGFLNPALYAIGTGPNYTTDFHDITSGNNTNTSESSKFFAFPGYDLCTGLGTPNGSNMINALAPPPSPILVTAGDALVSEGCLPTNGVIDPDETVTVSFAIENTGSVNTTNLQATLEPTGGVTSPNGPQNYGAVIAGGAAVSRQFIFTASGTCGGPLTATLQLTDGGISLGAVAFNFTLGEHVANPFAQNFDGVTAPTLPAGWTTSATGAESLWMTTTAQKDTAPNSAFAPDPASVGETELASPVFPVYTATAQVTFRNYYHLETGSGSTGYDGGVLDISINGGAFTDILSAGGSFVTGGYNKTISSNFGNPLAGRQAWSGNSGGFITTTANLPASAAGQNVQLEWICGTDNSKSSTGWYIDTISISDGFYTCCTPNADLAIGQTVAPNPAVVTNPLTYTLIVTNLGPSVASSITFTDALPAGVAFVSASPGLAYSAGDVTGTIASLGADVSTNYTITVTPSAAGELTNVVTVASPLPDPDLTNNTSSLTVAADAIPFFTNEPTNTTVVIGSNAVFQTTAGGTSPLHYQWFFNSTNLPGATTNTLALDDAQTNEAGPYYLIVSNLVGSATSTVVHLTVMLPPTVTTQPTNQIALPGATVTVVSAANGTSPLSYQWFFNGTNITGATSNTLTLTNVQAPEAGGYYLMITNPAGSTASSNAQLTILVPPSISSVKLTKTNLSVSLSSVIGLTYTLQYKNNVTDPAWTPLLPPLAGTGGTLILQDTNTAMASRFYRISVQ